MVEELVNRSIVWLIYRLVFDRGGPSLAIPIMKTTWNPPTTPELQPEDAIPDLPENREAREFLAKAPTKGLFMPLGKVGVV
jgi:hypothetical protein